jgi:tetratricopeptide (TPR) repeat protein
MIRRHDRQNETARDRARVAAELLEEARQLTDTAMLAATPAELTISPPPRDSAQRGNGHGSSNGNGNGHSHGNGNGHGAVARARTTPPPIRSEAERALTALDVSLASQPDSVPLLLERATQLGGMGRYAAARVDLERALALDPASVAVRSALGIVLLRKGLWASAVPHLRIVVEAESWSPTAWFYLGEALNHVDDLDGALAAFCRAAEIDPRHSKALYGQGVVLDRLRRPDDAARLYRLSREAAGR